jgi:hypothetical protein
VRAPDGRRAWVLGDRLRREAPGGGVEDVALPEGTRALWVPAGDWGFWATRREGAHASVVDPFAEGDSRVRAATLPGAGPRNAMSIDASRYLEQRWDAEQRRSWLVVDVARGTVAPAPGLIAADHAVSFVDRVGAFAWERDRRAPSGRLVRVEWATGSRTPVASGEGVPARLAWGWALCRTAGGAPVFRFDAFDGAWGCAVYDASKNELTRWTWWPTHPHVLDPDGEDGAIVAADYVEHGWRRIERVWWGSTVRVVLFPR